MIYNKPYVEYAFTLNFATKVLSDTREFFLYRIHTLTETKSSKVLESIADLLQVLSQ